MEENSVFWACRIGERGCIGAWIRRRQWSRITVESVRGDGESLNLVDRIEKMEEDLRNSATIIRGLSRQVEKLGIKFRVTRRTMKEPIAELWLRRLLKLLEH